MLSAAEIRDAKFPKSMGGYKQEDVDILLDKIEADYTQFERLINDYKTVIENQNKELEGYRTSQDSIQKVLLNAQKLADKIIEDAKTKSEEIVSNAESSISVITAREKELANAFEIKAEDRKKALEKELEEMIRTAKTKADSITAAAADSVARQQILFDKIKMEIAAFKSSITNKYREHLELLKDIPDTVPMDPIKMAELVSTAVDKAPNPADFVSKSENFEPQEELEEKEISTGFSVTNDDDTSTEE